MGDMNWTCVQLTVTCDTAWWQKWLLTTVRYWGIVWKGSHESKNVESWIHDLLEADTPGFIRRRLMNYSWSQSCWESDWSRTMYCRNVVSEPPTFYVTCFDSVCGSLSFQLIYLYVVHRIFLRSVSPVTTHDRNELIMQKSLRKPVSDVQQRLRLCASALPHNGHTTFTLTFKSVNYVPYQQDSGVGSYLAPRAQNKHPHPASLRNIWV
jgi:hypothetical protein